MSLSHCSRDSKQSYSGKADVMTLAPTPVTSIASQKAPYNTISSSVLERTTERRARSWQKEVECRDDDRLVRMNRVNPKYVLRNYLAQTAIEKAQQKDFSEIDCLLTLLQNPYSDQPGMDACAAPPPN